MLSLDVARKAVKALVCETVGTPTVTAAFSCYIKSVNSSGFSHFGYIKAWMSTNALPGCHAVIILWITDSLQQDGIFFPGFGRSTTQPFQSQPIGNRN